MKRLFVFGMMSALISACASQSPGTNSGFLAQQHYDQLTQIETASEQILFRYVSPAFDPSKYKRVIVEPVIAYPKPRSTEQVSMSTIETLQVELTMLLEESVSEVLALTRSPGSGVLRLQLAVTGINISDRPIEGYEYIPIALIAVGTQKASGNRDQRVKLFLEGKVTDSTTDEVLAVSIRELTGEDLEDANSKLEAKQLNQGMEAAANDWAAAFKRIFGN